jgi:hypothetical protein
MLGMGLRGKSMGLCHCLPLATKLEVAVRQRPGGPLDSFSSRNHSTKESILMATHSATGADARRSGAVSRATRRLATETKQAFKTTEFWAMVALVVAILGSAALIKGGDNGTDEFIARQAWLYVSILGAGYFISRGLAKSGSREPYTDEPDDRQ